MSGARYVEPVASLTRVEEFKAFRQPEARAPKPPAEPVTDMGTAALQLIQHALSSTGDTGTTVNVKT